MALVIMGTGEKEPIFHDFLGMTCAEAPVTVPADKGRESRASEVEVEASSAGGHALLSAGTSDLVSERQGVNTCEVFHFNGRKNAMSGPEISTSFSGRKRSSSDSAYMGMVSDRVIPVGSDSLESSRLMKMLGKEMTGERLGKSHDDETVFSMQPPPRPSSLILHPPTGSRPDSLIYKWERSVPSNPGQMTHYPPRFAQAVNYGEKPSSSSYPYRDAIVTGASLISQAAADEGSRTGIRSSGALTVANPSGGFGERNSAVVLPCSSSRPKAPLVIEQDPSNMPSRHTMASASRQMTIFYAGQAHVFDDVHPNKADVIMALAGSTGVSWSTTYSTKPGVPAPPPEAKLPSRENEIRNTFASSTQGNSSRPLPGQAISRVPVITDSPKLPTAETRSTTIQAAGTEAEGKRDV